MLTDGCENMLLTAGIADERVAHPRYSDEMIRATLESVFTDVFVEQTAPDSRDKFGRWPVANEDSR
jgi:hypothetical protein